MSKDEDIADLLPWDEGFIRSVDCGPGWNALILELNAELLKIDPEYKVAQVKEKFGTLRYYTSGYLEGLDRTRFFETIMSAEAVSAHTCEECGGVGVLRNTRWVRTLCDACDASRTRR